MFEDEQQLDAVALEGWKEEQVEEYLVMAGDGLHFLLKVGPDDLDTFRMTERDLERMVDPLTRILNRYDATRAAAAMGDEGLLIAAIGAYATRNYTRRRRLIVAIRALPEQPSSGRAAVAGSGPEHDPAWQATQAGLGAPDQRI